MAVRKSRASDRRGAQGPGREGAERPSSSVEPSGLAAGGGPPDPVGLLVDQDKAREPDLVPVRHGRMLVSPFTFYRGSATIMATDLAGTPTAGLDVQLCGDAHLSNFGAFASPERHAGVQLERLRRDAARAVRVRREADGRELRHRSPEQQVQPGRGAKRRDRSRPHLSIGDGGVRRHADAGHLVRAHDRGRRRGLR